MKKKKTRFSLLFFGENEDKIKEIKKKYNLYRLMRKARRLTINELAEQLSVAPDEVINIERGEVSPSDELKKAYSESLNISEKIWSRYENPKPGTLELLYLIMFRMIVEGKM